MYSNYIHELIKISFKSDIISFRFLLKVELNFLIADCVFFCPHHKETLLSQILFTNFDAFKWKNK